MPSPLTLVLWPGSGTIFERDLLGRPLWQRTLEATRSLRPNRTLFVLNRRGRLDLDGVSGIDPVPKKGLGDKLGRVRGKLVLLPAEVPCLSSRSLKRLVSASRSGASRLMASERPGRKSTPILCCTADRIRQARGALDNGLDSLAGRLDASIIQPAEWEDVLRVETTSDWIAAAKILRRRACERLVSGGVLLDDPSTVQIDPDVKVGRGTRIRSWVVIEGASRIGTLCDIGSFTHIVDSTVGSRTVLLDHCVIRSSRIGKRAQVGPFAHLRPESLMADKSKVGNFVEMKKSSLGTGSKAPHLTYLGDATIGRGVNVGAGTITCNYDGEEKYQTIIEDGAFIGSDVQLVAPVRVGRGAYVAAGSSIVEDVPAGSLAIARGRQVVKPGYARRARQKRPAKKRRG